MTHNYKMGARAAGLNSATAPLSAVQQLPARLDAATETRRLRAHDRLVEGIRTLSYQPQLDLTSLRVAGVEALFSVLGHDASQPVGDVIADAEGEGLHLEVAVLWLHTACRERRRWLEAAGSDFPVCVPVTQRALEHPGFVTAVRDTLQVCELSPALLELEVPEAALLSARAGTSLAQLRTDGVAVCVDGFGSPQSSFRTLTCPSVTKLRIAPALVRAAVTSADAAAMLRAIAAAARALGLGTCAAGVDGPLDADQPDVYGCALAQGTGVGAPMPGNEMLEMLVARGADTAELPLLVLSGECLRAYNRATAG